MHKYVKQKVYGGSDILGWMFFFQASGGGGSGSSSSIFLPKISRNQNTRNSFSVERRAVKKCFFRRCAVKKCVFLQASKKVGWKVEGLCLLFSYSIKLFSY